MASILRFRKLCYVEPVKCSSLGYESYQTSKGDEKQHSFENPKADKKSDGGAVEKVFVDDKSKKQRPRRQPKKWRCIDSCCWLIGCLCTTWWLLLFLYHCFPVNLPGLAGPELPGARLKREGLTAVHPVVLVPGIVTGGLELWEGRPCSEGLFRKRLWGGSFTEIFKRTSCWMEHLSLHNETGLDPPGIRVRAVPGLVAADYFAPGYFVWAVLIENLARIGYEDKNMYMAAYDWRLSFQNTEIRDQALSRLKSKIELMYVTNGYKKVVVLPHSMGAIYFLHFLKWVEAPRPMGGGGGPNWCAKYIKSVLNIGPTFLGVPKAVRAMATGLVDSEYLTLQTIDNCMRVSRTWDSVISLVPKGGDAIWGNLDWSPEEDECKSTKKSWHTSSRENSSNNDKKRLFQIKEPTKYGRIISFGKAASELPSSQLPTLDSKELKYGSTSADTNGSFGEAWTESNEISQESIRRVTKDQAYTAKTVMDLLRLIAPKTMQRAEAHFSHGVAGNLDDPKYDHYKYWSNPLETKLPDAPGMEIYCLYGAGMLTERSYVYKMSPSDRYKNIPFRLDTSADGGDGGCLKSGVYYVDGDETVPVLSAGFMCAKGWRGKTRFNPSGITTYVREYQHKAPASLLEGRGLESGAHVDIMGNVALIEDVLQVAAGATGAELGGDKVYSDIVRMSERVNIRL